MKRPCPICGQQMDFCAITYRNHPFIDGKCYKRMCFCCSHVPQDYVQVYDEKGSVLEEQGPFFDYKHLRSAEELVLLGSADDLQQAKRCLRGVKRVLAEVGVVALKKLKLHQPEHKYVELTDGDYDGDDVDDEDEEVVPRTRPKPKAVEKKPKPVIHEVTIKKFTASKKPRPLTEDVA